MDAKGLETDDERERLQRLLDLRLLDTPPEPLFDALTRAAAELTGSPVALVTLIDQQRQWFKSNYGLPGVESTARSTAICDYAIRGEELMRAATCASRALTSWWASRTCAFTPARP